MPSGSDYPSALQISLYGHPIHPRPLEMKSFYLRGIDIMYNQELADEKNIPGTNLTD